MPLPASAEFPPALDVNCLCYVHTYGVPVPVADSLLNKCSYRHGSSHKKCVTDAVAAERRRTAANVVKVLKMADAAEERARNVLRCCTIIPVDAVAKQRQGDYAVILKHSSDVLHVEVPTVAKRR